MPGSNLRVTNHTRSASEGTRQSLSPGRLRESHFDSGFPWKKGTPRMRLPLPLRSPELERIEMASLISDSENMTGVGAGIAVLAQKPNVGYPRFAGAPIPDVNFPLTPLTNETTEATNRSSMRPRIPPLAPPPNKYMISPPPPSILPPLRRAFSVDSYTADRPYSDGAQYLDVSPPHPFPPAISTPSSSKHATPPVDQPQTPSPPSSPSPPPVPDVNYLMTTATRASGHSVSALLGPNAFGVRSDGASDYATTGFRDSAYTTGTSTNEWKSEVPIRWTPSIQVHRGSSSNGHESAMSSLLPGGWNPTPVEEKEEDAVNGFGDPDHDFPIPSYERQRTPERHNADAPRSPEIVEQEDMGRLGSVGVVGVYGEQEFEEIQPSRTTPPREGRPLRVSDSSVMRVPPNKLKRLSEGWVMVNVENSSRRPPIAEEPVPVPTRRGEANPRVRAQRMLRGRSHSDPQLRPPGEQNEHDQYSRPRPSQSQKNLGSRDNPSKSGRDRDRSGHRDRERDKDRVDNRTNHYHSMPLRPSGSNPPQNVSKGTTSNAAKAIAMADAATSREKDHHNYTTYPGITQTPISPGQRTLKKLLNRGETIEKSKKSSKKSKKHVSSRSHQVD